MAIHPNTVNENLRFEKVIIFKVIDIKNEIPIFNLRTEVGHWNNSKIEWKELTESDMKLFNRQ